MFHFDTFPFSLDSLIICMTKKAVNRSSTIAPNIILKSIASPIRSLLLVSGPNGPLCLLEYPDDYQDMYINARMKVFNTVYTKGPELMSHPLYTSHLSYCFVVYSFQTSWKSFWISFIIMNFATLPPSTAALISCPPKLVFVSPAVYRPGTDVSPN